MPNFMDIFEQILKFSGLLSLTNWVDNKVRHVKCVTVGVSVENDDQVINITDASNLMVSVPSIQPSLHTLSE